MTPPHRRWQRWIAVLCLWLPVLAVRAVEYKTVDIGNGVYSFGDGSYFSVFAVGSRGVVATDPVNPAFAAEMLAAIRKVSNQPVRFIVYSHNHFDHITGGQVFRQAGAKVLAHEAARQWLRENRHPDVVMPDIGWRGDRHRIDLGGGQIVELLHVGPSHGTGMTVVRLPKASALFVVDLVSVQQVGYMDLPDYTPRGWLRALQDIEAMPGYDTVLLAHGQPAAKREHVTQMREYVHDLREAVQQAIRAGQDPLKIQLPKYREWARYEEWLPLNAMRVTMEVYLGW